MKAERRLLAVSAGLAGPLGVIREPCRPSETNSSASPGLQEKPLASAAALTFVLSPSSHPITAPPLPPDCVSWSCPPSHPPPRHTSARTARGKFIGNVCLLCVRCAFRREAGLQWREGGGWGGGAGGEGKLANVCRLTFHTKSLPHVQQSVSLLYHQRTSQTPTGPELRVNTSKTFVSSRSLYLGSRLTRSETSNWSSNTPNPPLPRPCAQSSPWRWGSRYRRYSIPAV